MGGHLPFLQFKLDTLAQTTTREQLISAKTIGQGQQCFHRGQLETE